MEIELSEITTCQMRLAAIAAYPGECCGILLGVRGKNGKAEVREIREAHNQIQGKQKSTRFQVDSLFLYQVEREIEGSGFEVVGFYHSHPDCPAIPSDEDYENMVPELAYVILSVTKEGIKDTRCYEKDINY